MGILGKLMFWKKEEEMDDDGPEEGGELPVREMPPEEGRPNTEVPPWSQGREEQPSMKPAFEQPEMERPVQTGGEDSGHQIIIAKLDVINAKLESLNQRLSNLERYAEEESKKANKW